MAVKIGCPTIDFGVIKLPVKGVKRHFWYVYEQNIRIFELLKSL